MNDRNDSEQVGKPHVEDPTWSPESWCDLPTAQQPLYDDPSEVESVVEHLKSLPPLVTSWEIESLRNQLADAARGNRFLLQGGCIVQATLRSGCAAGI